MPSARGAKTGLIITGLVFGASLLGNIQTILDNYTGNDRDQQQIITGDLHFATDGTTSPSITLNGTDVIQIDTSGDIALTGALNSSGGLAPIYATFNESNLDGDGTASGWYVQNPYPNELFCDRVVLRTSIAPTDGVTVVVMDVGTGTFLSGAASGNTLLDNYTLAAETNTASGTRVAYASGYQKVFTLDEKGGTTDYFSLGVQSGTGGGWIANFHANCYNID